MLSLGLSLSSGYVPEKIYGPEYADFSQAYANVAVDIVDPVIVESSDSISFDDTTYEPSDPDTEIEFSANEIYNETLPGYAVVDNATSVTVSGKITKNNGTGDPLAELDDDGTVWIYVNSTEHVRVYVDKDYAGTVASQGVVVSSTGVFTKTLNITGDVDRIQITAWDILNDPDTGVLISDMSITLNY